APLRDAGHVHPRDADHAPLRDAASDLDAALKREFQDAGLCDRVIAVSEAEAQVLRRAGLSNVSVIGHMRDLRLTPRSFAERSGMLFLGAIHEAGSPNHDALEWFIEQVLPLIEKELGWQTRLTVAGYLAPGVDLERWRGHRRVTLRGAVSDPVVLYETHRMVVAPTRFAAGIPYKVHEAASFGVPVVATSLLAGQLGWRDGDELLAAGADDPAGFAAAVIRLSHDEELWGRLREAAAGRIAAEHGRERYAAAVGEILDL
ncbi:MAG: glycosyltransferase, partial [Acetobacteraceae bacterium]